MTLKRVFGPYATLGVCEDMVHGPNHVVHLVLKVLFVFEDHYGHFGGLGM